MCLGLILEYINRSVITLYVPSTSEAFSVSEPSSPFIKWCGVSPLGSKAFDTVSWKVVSCAARTHAGLLAGSGPFDGHVFPSKSTATRVATQSSKCGRSLRSHSQPVTPQPQSVVRVRLLVGCLCQSHKGGVGCTDSACCIVGRRFASRSRSV
jgi:hypothetical protein